MITLPLNPIRIMIIKIKSEMAKNQKTKIAIMGDWISVKTKIKNLAMEVLDLVDSM